MTYLLRLYELMPAWVLAVVLLAAGGSWLINFHWQRQYERLPLYPPMSLALAASLGMLGLFYFGLAFAPVMSENARAGGVRMLLLVHALATIIYNGGMIARSMRKFRQARKGD